MDKGSNSSQQSLLQQATNVFTDKAVSATVVKGEYFVSNNGYGYILIDNSKNKKIEISSIHLVNNQEQSTAGINDNAYVNIQTPIALENVLALNNTESYVICYGNFYIMINSLRSNHRPDTLYHYVGELLHARNTRFLIVNKSDMEEQLNINSIPIWLKHKGLFPCPIFPSYLSPSNMDCPFLSIEIDTTDGWSIVSKEGNYTKQYKRDKGRIYLINGDATMAQDIIYLLNTLCIDYDPHAFGVNNFLKWYTSIADRQNAFSLMSNKKICDISINYWLYTKSKTTLEDFRGMLAQINGHRIDLFVPNDLT